MKNSIEEAMDGKAVLIDSVKIWAEQADGRCAVVLLGDNGKGSSLIYPDITTLSRLIEQEIAGMTNPEKARDFNEALDTGRMRGTLELIANLILGKDDD